MCAVVARQDYLPFGEEIPADTAGRSSSLLFGASDGVEQKFTGQIRDSETGMDFFTARYYASAVGRFMSPDPANAGADLLDPQSWNAYAYVRNNPLALVDPMGLCHMGADNVAYDDEPGDCGGGSVTVVASAPPDVMPIFVSLPSLLSDTQQSAQTAPPPTVTEAGVGVRPPKNDPPPSFVPIDILKWIPPIKPRFCFNDAFGYVGGGAKIPYTNIHAEGYLIPADYESGKGLSSGLLVEAEIPHTPIAVGAERSYNWKSGTWSTDGLAFANKDAGGARLGAVNVGALADQHGNVGGYGGVGPIGGGITFRFSLFGCD